MTDKEKVVKSLETCSDVYYGATGACSSCSFSQSKNCFAELVHQTIELLKEQEDSIRILTDDLEALTKEHEKLLDKKIPLITNGQEVVRCKDCKYWRQNTEFCGRWSVGNVARHTPPDWFCADGERR